MLVLEYEGDKTKQRTLEFIVSMKLKSINTYDQ
jgi:hypothetical protein